MKKMIAIVTVLALMIGIFQVPGGVFAEEKTQISLKQAIEIAKTTLNLKTDGFEFNSSYMENQNGFNVWSLNWNNTKTNTESINVSVDSSNGEIVSVGWYTPYEQPKSRIPKHTKAEALKAAEAWAAKLQGDKFKLTKVKENPSHDYYSKYSDVYAFEFVRVQDGVEVAPNMMTVQLDKNTLNLRYFYMVWDNKALPSKAKAITLDKAKDLFKSKLGIELTYNLIYNNPTTEPKAVLAYSLKKGNSPIDAISGELLTNMMRIYYAMDKVGATVAQAEAVKVTPQEQSALDNSSKYISKEDAVKAALKYITIDSGMTLERANLYPGYHNINASWNLEWKSAADKDGSYKYLNAQVDAITKELNHYSTYSYNEKIEKGAKLIEKEAAKKLAEDFLKKIQPEKFAKTEYRDSKDLYGYGIMPAYQNDYNFNFIRVENGIPCPSNSLNVSVNQYTGQVISYNANWMNIEFPKPENVISLEKAYETLFNKVKFAMEYTYHYPTMNDYDKKELRLAYALENTTIMMDAKTGEMIGYDGNPVKPTEKLTYTDIKGNKAEDEINVLIDMGILVPESTTFAPDANMLQKNFIKLVVNSLQEYYPAPVAKDANLYDNFYAEAIRRKLITEADKNPDAVITRQDAAKILVRALNYGVIAEKGSMFAANFKDAASLTAANKGYAVMAAELGIVPAVDGSFLPAKAITRGDAAEFIVNYLKCETSL